MLVSPCPSSAARICRTCTNMPQSTGQYRRCQRGWKKRRNRYVILLLPDWRWIFGGIFIARGAAMLPAQACAKWPPYFLFRAHDRARWKLNSTNPFHHEWLCKVAILWYFIGKPCCVRLFPFKQYLNAQRSHVTSICSTILLTFSLVKASGIGLGRGVLFVSECQGETLSLQPRLTARRLVLTATALPCVLPVSRRTRSLKICPRALLYD